MATIVAGKDTAVSRLMEKLAPGRRVRNAYISLEHDAIAVARIEVEIMEDDLPLIQKAVEEGETHMMGIELGGISARDMYLLVMGPRLTGAGASVAEVIRRCEAWLNRPVEMKSNPFYKK